MDERSYYIKLYEALATPTPGAVEAMRKLGIEPEETMHQTLYEVTLFDIRDRDIYITQVVASSPDIAKMRAVAEVGWNVDSAEYFDIFAREIGHVRNAPKVEAGNGGE